ncbi:integrase, catalytic region, zinc finger, CCHC-type containing protein [Tanacetum coccineum]
MLAEAQEAGQILDEEQLALLADPGVLDGQVVLTIIPNTDAFQTEDLDTYDSDCDDLSNAQAVLMANISIYGSDIISKVVQIVLWYLEFGCSKHMIGNHSQLMNFVSKFLGTVRFRNDHIARIMGYGDYQLGNVTISRVYYVEGLGHNLFSVEGVDLLSGSRDTNLYTISLDDMLKTSPICLLSKASKSKSWLWHRRLSHLNFGKSKKSSHQPKAEDTNQEKLYLLHMDLCGPMRVASINGKKAEAINTACYTQNRSIIRRQYNKTLYEPMQDKKPDLSFFYLFSALCYPTNDNDNLGKLDAKADIGIFVSYAPSKKAFRIYNKRTQKIIETIHVTFDELTAMASEQFSSGAGLHSMTPATSSSGLVLNIVSQQPCIPPNRDDCDYLFQPMFDEYFTPPAIVVPPIQEAAASRAVDIDQDAPSSSTPSTQEQEQSPNISQGFEESPKTPIFHDDPLNESPHEEITPQGSSSNVRQTHTPFEHLGKWTKDHPIANVIGDPSWKQIFKKRNKKKAKNKQIQARNGKDKVKSQPSERKYNLRG